MDAHASDDTPQVVGAVSRRQFIERTGVTTGGVIALGMASGLPVLESAQAAAVEQPPTALTQAEMTTLKAILARLLPRDELGPGAVEAGVHVYIDRSLAGAYASLLPMYRQSLATINKGAKRMGAASFAALSPAHQDTLLKQVEAGKLATGTGRKAAPAGANGTGGKGLVLVQQQFFLVLLEHMREGMFGDPMYGGNRNFAGWNLIDYPGVKLVYTVKDQAVGTRIAPAHQSDAAYGGHPAS